MRTVLPLPVLFLCWISFSCTVWAQSGSNLSTKAQQLIQRAKQFVEQQMFAKATQQFQRASSLLQQSLQQAQTTEEQKQIKKLLQSCFCNGGYAAELGQQLFMARDWYQKCLATGISARLERRIQRSLLNINAAILRSAGMIIVRSQPSSTQVQLIKQGGSGRFETTPFSLQMEPGIYTVIIQAPGYETKKDQITVAQKSRIHRVYVLKKMGTISLQTTPNQAQVQILGPNRFRQNVETPITQHLPEGTYSLVVRKLGYQLHRTRVRIQSAVTTRKQIALLPQGATVSIETNPPQADIQIQDASGNKPSGSSPFKTAVAAGPFTLTIRKAGFQTISQRDTAITGAHLDRRFILAPLVPPKQPLARALAWSFVGLTAATAATGIVMFVVAQNEFTLVEKMRGNTATSNEEINTVYNRGLSFNTTGMVLSIVAGATLATAIGLFIWNGGKAQDAPPSAEKSTNTNHLSKEQHHRTVLFFVP